jgi:RNA recognition motif-containing protein
MRRIFVGNVPDGTTVEDLETLFSDFGDIANLYFVKGDQMDGSRYGYVVYDQIDAAQRVLASKDRFYIDRQQLRVEEFGGKRAFTLKQKPGPSVAPASKKLPRDPADELTRRSKPEERSLSSEIVLAVDLLEGIDGALNLAAAQATKTISHRKVKECSKSHLINVVNQNKSILGAAASNSSCNILDSKFTLLKSAKPSMLTDYRDEQMLACEVTT